MAWMTRAAPAVLILLFLGMLPLGCAPMMALYSPAAYERAVSLKVESLALTAHAREPYAEHEAELRALRLELDKAREFARGRPKNEISARQWEILLDPARSLLGELLARWQKGEPIGEVYLEEKRRQIAAAFDTIIGLESHKLRPGDFAADGRE